MTHNPSTSPKAKVSPKTEPRLAAAIARGEVVRRKLAAGEGGSTSTARAARRLGVSQATVLRRWRRHRLIAWKHGIVVRVPVWQFSGGKMVSGTEEVLQIFRSEDQWRLLRYFLGKRVSLGGRRPLDLLREGKAAEVIAHAKRYAADNTW